MPIFAELAYRAGIGVDELLFLRFLLAFIMLGVVLTVSHRLKFPRIRDLGLMVALGALAYFLQSSFYFTALLYSPVPIVELILYTYPAFVIVSSRLLGWEAITRRIMGSVAVAIVGLVLVAGPLGASLGPGVVLALLASVTYTAYILGSVGVLKRVTGEVASFYVMGAACLSFGLAASLGSGLVSPDWQPLGWVWILMIALVSTVVAVTTFFLGLSLIGPSKSSLISLLEPLTAATVAFVVFGEGLSTLQAFGGLLNLLSAVVVAVSRNPQKRKL